MSKSTSVAPVESMTPRETLLAGLAALDFADWLMVHDMLRYAYATAPAPAGFDWTKYVVPYPGSQRPADEPLTHAEMFAGTAIPDGWVTVGGTWAVKDGALSQTSLNGGDPEKALCNGGVGVHAERVTCMARVDSWVPGSDGSRAGVSLCNDATGSGYNLVFRDGKVQFLDDARAWGASLPYPWAVGTWYIMKVQWLDGTLSGKVWEAGTSEPAQWMLTQPGWAARAPGVAGLNGGSGTCRVSFKSFTAERLQAPAPPAPDASLPAERWYVAGTDILASRVESHLAHFGLQDTIDLYRNLGISKESATAAGLWGQWFTATHPEPDDLPEPYFPEANPEAPPEMPVGF